MRSDNGQVGMEKEEGRKRRKKEGMKRLPSIFVATGVRADWRYSGGGQCAGAKGASRLLCSVEPLA